MGVIFMSHNCCRSSMTSSSGGKEGMEVNWLATPTNISVQGSPWQWQLYECVESQVLWQACLCRRGHQTQQSWETLNLPRQWRPGGRNCRVWTRTSWEWSPASACWSYLKGRMEITSSKNIYWITIEINISWNIVLNIQIYFKKYILRSIFIGIVATMYQKLKKDAG